MSRADVAAQSPAERLRTFVIDNTQRSRAPLVPEIELHLARDSCEIFAAAERMHRKVPYPPFWAFAWPGGQALARYLLDRPQLVAGRHVIDIGAGSGIGALAAVRAGAAYTLAADIDPLAVTAMRMAADVNRLGLAITTEDLLATLPDCDLIMVADLVYEPVLATRVASFLEAAARSGAHVLMADRTTARRPPLAFELVAEHDAPVWPEFPGSPFERARVWRMVPDGQPRRRRHSR